ncbi:hypothetical protein niasHT_031948 [Heterodera trifolii]|uniref:NR LBD domain-containing protein n=1 Tax=Heterodera trifolii TaxID=157864 RepID=A0ABD2HT81_9BILA
MLKHLLEVEQKVCRIRNSQTPICESFYDQCDSFESIFEPTIFGHGFVIVPEIAKTFPSFGQLITNDKIALCSNIAMPLVVLSKSFYSVQQNCDVICDPNQGAMKMGDRLLCKSVQSFSRLKLSAEEFVLVRQISDHLESPMIAPGVSNNGKRWMNLSGRFL